METTPIQTLSYLNEEGTLSPSCPYVPPPEVLVQGYRIMVLCRHVDERMITLQRQGAITFAMSGRGEEACAVASAAALESCDWLYPQYRESGIVFWRGLTISEYIHHMFGDAKDPSLGRQMPNHFGSRKLNVVTVSSPIATKIPHAAGCGYAMKLQGEDSIAVCYFGEGATSEGDFHGGVNFAAVRRSPTIFFCRNNGYAISTPVSEQFACDGVAVKGYGYGIKSYRVDGNDFFAVYSAVKESRARCLAGEGPVLIEALTYRIGAHSTSDDPTRYRSDEEVALYKSRCPLQRLRLYLEKEGLWSDEKERLWYEEVKQEVTEAIEEAKKTPPPQLLTLFEDVYFEMPESLKEQYRDALRFFDEDGGSHG